MKDIGNPCIKRNTIQRELVLRSVQQLKNHPTPEHIFQHIHTSHPRISRGTVYRNLGVLIEEGLIRRVSIPDGADRMDFKTEPHYHLQCLGCGNVYDVNFPYLQHYEEAFENDQGFLIVGHQMTFTGYCHHCRVNNSERTENLCQEQSEKQ